MLKKTHNRSSAFWLALFVLLAVCGLYCAAGFLFRRPVILLKEDRIVQEAGEPFAAADHAEARLCSPLPLIPDRICDVLCDSSVSDFSHPGEVTVTFRCEAGNKSASVTVPVDVRDTTPPELTLLRREGYVSTRLSGYEEEGFTAADRVDGDITALVTVTQEGEDLRYSVTDSSGNTASVLRCVPYQHSRVTFERFEDDCVEIPRFDYVVVPDCAAHDGFGNDISDRVRWESDISPSYAGRYTVTYYVEDEDGCRVEYEVDAEVDACGLDRSYEDPGEKVIYLTFDDGPSAYTEHLLDILDRYGVKATFFVTGWNSYDGLITEEARRGHAVGCHTYTHDYETIYAGPDAFYYDLARIEDLVHERTGRYSRLIRFPGGSSNEISYDEENEETHGIMSYLTGDVMRRGYRYFDWNVSSGDGGSRLETEEVFRRVKEGVQKHDISVVLQHDTKDWSIEAVPMIIEWALENGYTFRTLDETSFQAYHNPVN